jgi:hypothetical protein
MYSCLGILLKVEEDRSSKSCQGDGKGSLTCVTLQAGCKIV